MSSADNYQVFSDVEHVLKKPGMYVGSNQIISEEMYVMKDDKIVKKNIEYIPALQRIYEEIILNAFDQTVREGTGCTEIHVSIEPDTNTISVYNNGEGIPIVLKEELGCYVPEMIFGMLRSSSNYKDETRITGGTNGLGSKLTNIFSKVFTLETVDSTRKKLYVQEWSNNMENKTEPEISSFGRKKPYTRITYQSDLNYFKLKIMSDDMIALMKKRLVDIGFASHSRIKTFYDDESITIKKTEDYMKLYCPDSQDTSTFMVDTSCERWTIGIMLSNGFKHASFVNGIHTSLGGSHVDHVMNIISKEVIEKLKKKIDLKPSDVRNKLFVFIKCAIENPVFDSQTKECLKMSKTKFGSEYIMGEAFKKKLLSSKLIELMMNVSEDKLFNELAKTGGVKTSRLAGVKGLEDANWAGTSKSISTKLILTEGLSAKTFAMSAINVIGRDRFGIFPLKGKPLNVRGVAISKVTANVEICSIVKILGLQYGTKYTDVSTLRYGGAIILTDADSVSGDTPLLLKDISTGMIMHKNIEDLTNEYSININGKEYGSNDNYLIWTEKGWTKIKHIMRHKVSKKMFRVLTHTGCVDVTEDHSLINLNGEEITPNNCKVGQHLMHAFPQFSDSKIRFDSPISKTLLKAYNIRVLKDMMRERGIQNITYSKKEECINSLLAYDNGIEHSNPTEGLSMIIPKSTELELITNISLEEAWVLGFFMADGSCDNYTWSYQKKPKNRPNTYTFTRTNHSWHLDNCNLSLLEKAKAILTNIYGDIFNLTQTDRESKNLNSVNSTYRLILNGGKKTSYIIDKYRELLYYKKSKYFHPILLNASLEYRQQLFEGFYEGDGRHNKDNVMTVDCNGKMTTQSLYTLCVSLGLRVSINHNDRKPNVYSCIITPHNGIQQKSRTVIKKIIELPVVEDMYVYDLETDNHHFQAGIGEMIVHNTDGSHICGLILNLFHYFWPELLQLGYMSLCATPIVKVYQSSDIIPFYTLNDYETWLEQNGTKQFRAKYFKGLGTSTAAEAREALDNIDDKIITFGSDALVDQSINLAFDKKLTNDRKLWLMERYDPKDNIDRNIQEVPVSDYINKELIHFSYYDNQRSIPNVMDGLKPSQRKILYTAIKYLSVSEMKVAQFGAKVAEKTDYHHGEASLMGAVIGMAQNYMGSNNINLLEPLGGFGTRLNANDAASPRYIFTKLTDVAKKVFDNRDSQLLKYLDSDGMSIEPEWFVPIIPIILVNGTIGIGSGFSTEVLKYNPADLCKYLMKLLDNGRPVKNLKPWYRGFKGTIERIDTGKYRTIGCYSFDDAKRTLRISELPVGVWTDDYKEFIEGMLLDKAETAITDVRHGSSDVVVCIDIIIKPSEYERIREMDTEDFLLKFKLISKLSCTNMYLFDHEGIISKYSNVYEILKEFYTVRLDYYVKRRDAIIAVLQYELNILKNKVMFIKHVKEGKIKLQKIADESLLSYLIENQFYQNNGVYGSPLDEPTLKEFAYLIDMPIKSITYENAKKLEKQTEAKEAELEAIIKLSANDMWKSDLSDLLEAVEQSNIDLEVANASSKPVKMSSKPARKSRAKKN